MSTAHRAGLPLKEVVELTEIERDALELRMSSYRRRIPIACVTLVLGGVVPCASIELAPSLLLPIAIGFWFVGAPALGLWARDGHKRAAALRRDLHEGVIAVHAGSRLRFAIDEVAIRLLEKLHIDAEEIEIRVLPESSLLLHLQGDMVDGWHELPVVEVGESPPIRWKAFAKVGPGKAEARMRDLTAEERAEIESMRNALIRMSWVEVALLAWGGLAVVSWFLELGGHWLTRIVALCVGGGVLLRFLGRLRAFYLLGRDLKIGELIVVVGDQSTMEMCPGSQTVWTVDGEPAPWRSVKPRLYKG